jgi:gliding motility-associated lipoprotein GldB
MKKIFFFILLFLFIVVIFSCNTNDKKSRVSNINLPVNDTVKVKIQRYEKALFGVDIKNLKNGLEKLKPEYGFFLDGDLNDTMNLIQIKSYITDTLIVNIYKNCNKIFPDVKDLEVQFTKAFHYLKYYFPDIKHPKVYTYISGLDYEMPVKYADSVLVIALDMYLGSNYKYYKMIGQPLYRQNRFRNDFIMPDCMREIAKTKIDNSMENKKLIDIIIYEGKVLYFLDAMLPDTPDSLKIYYSPSQMEWCSKNESNVWSFIIDKKLLYSSDPSMIEKLCADGPFTAVFSKQSPSRVGIWIGWQIVREFMENNKQITLKELFSDQDSQSILTRSKYKPQK